MSPSSLLLLIGALLISPALSLNCASKIQNVYANCTVLPTLGAILHWNYTAANSTLSFTFGVNTTKGQWSSFGINAGKKTGMDGAFAFVAINSKSGNLSLKQYNLTFNSRPGITEQPLPWTVRNASAVAGSDEAVWISATVSQLPALSELNTLWQVGPLGADNAPTMHSMGTENMEAKTTLQLTAGKSVAPGVSPSPAPSGGSESDGENAPPITPVQSPGNATGSSSANWKSTANLYPLLSVLGVFGLVL
ncbi:unnamed protein product [Cuscuta europaea]|uniref:DOMON domain-containing protein n=1 Tax=Cuscuta europaea TaxID=41803 RepID=A0A9P0ZCH4_CUSEU|nr:unnamed protein product [Cuscuta europaea]